MKKELLEIIKVVEFHVENIIKILKLRIERQRERANVLGIKKIFDSQELLPDLEDDLTQIKQSMGKMKKRIEAEQLNDAEQELASILEKYKQASKKIEKDLYDCLESYHEFSKKDLRIALDTMVREAVYKIEYDRLSKEKKFLTFKPYTLIDRLLGELRMRKAKVGNLAARIKRAEIKRKKVSSTRRVEDMLRDMYECAEEYNDGLLTDEMQRIENGIRQIFKDVLPRKKMMTTKKGSQSLVVSQKKELALWARKRKEANKLDEETKRIEAQNEENEKDTQEESPAKMLTQAYAQIKSLLNEINILVQGEERERSTHRKPPEPEY